MDLKRFHAIFAEEASEHLKTLEDGLMQLEKTPDDDELLNSIFRAAHTIKGSSGTIGLPDIAKFTHIMEEILESMRSGELRADKRLVSTLLEALDMIKEMVAAVMAEVPFPFERCHDLMARMNTLRIPRQEESTKEPVSVTANDSNNFQNNFMILFTPLNQQFTEQRNVLAGGGQAGNLNIAAILNKFEHAAELRFLLIGQQPNCPSKVEFLAIHFGKPGNVFGFARYGGDIAEFS